MKFFNVRPLFAMCAILAALAFVVTDADARGARSGSSGSRGTHTTSTPPSTATAPNSAKPMERTMTQPGSPSTVGRTGTAPGAGGFFNRPGFMGGLMGGLLGAGLFGLLMGHGFGGGLGGFASILGLMLQIGLIAIVGYMIWTWWQRRQQPATAAGPMLRDYNPGSGTASSMGFGGGSAAPAQPAAAGSDEVGLTRRRLQHLRAHARRRADRLRQGRPARVARAGDARNGSRTTPRIWRRTRAAASSTTCPT